MSGHPSSYGELELRQGYSSFLPPDRLIICEGLSFILAKTRPCQKRPILVLFKVGLFDGGFGEFSSGGTAY